MEVCFIFFAGNTIMIDPYVEKDSFMKLWS